jgi:glycerophosphoryl diester phosphodiesterase
VAEAAKADALGYVCFGGFEVETLRTAREAGAPVTGAATEEIRQALTLARLGLPPVRPSYRAVQVPERAGATEVVTARFVRALHRADLPVAVWTVDAADDMHRLLGLGVDGIITDRPDVAVDVVSRWRR